MKYVFLFGRTPQLAWEELRSIAPQATRLNPHGALVYSRDGRIELVSGERVSARVCLDRLGGTVKIATVHQEVTAVDTDTLVALVRRVAKSARVVFGISHYGDSLIDTKRLARSVKTALARWYGHLRYVQDETGTLSSVVVAKQHVVDIVIVTAAKSCLVAETVAVQDFESWNTHDYGRPNRDPRSGMLPPKVARMIVNIASRYARGEGRLLLDPFCGVGTILSEALRIGWTVVGSDLAKDAVEKATANIGWLSQTDRFVDEKRAKLFVGDATHVSHVLEKETVDAIVTEPYMGSTRLGKIDAPAASSRGREIRNTIRGLEKLYIGCLRDWHGVLKSHGVVIIALPEYHIGGRSYFVKRVIDSCETLGYTEVLGPIEYSRPQAVVRREFFVLTKN